VDEDGSGGGRGLAGCGCATLAGGLVATALAVTLALALVAGTAFAGLFHAAGGTRSAPRAGGVGLADLGFGPSDAARVERIIAALAPGSPLRGHGADIVASAAHWQIDPLLLVGVWMQESRLCTTGLNTPTNGNWNCGNLIWVAAAPYAGAYGCALGGASLGHQWAFCPGAAGGIGSWFEYVASSPVYAGVRTFAAFAPI
jgi:hypothetical protein